VTAAVSAAATANPARVAELERRLEKATSDVQAARTERLELERLKMASERISLDLKQEKIRLEEESVMSEERAIAAQEEADAKDALVLEAKEAQMKAEIRVEELTARFTLTEGKAHEFEQRAREAQMKSSKADAEMHELEAEKYQLTDDIETLESELEEANSQIKRYYELVAERDAALARRKEEVDGLERKLQRAEYEKELTELRNNPVEEGGEDIDQVYAQLDQYKASIVTKDREIAKLLSELDTFKLTIDDERPTGGRLSAASAAASSPPRDRLEESDDFGSTLNQERKRSEAEAKKAAAQSQKDAAELQRLKQRCESAEQSAGEARRAMAVAEKAARDKEAEVMGLIKKVGDLEGGVGGGDDALAEQLAEREDELYDVRTQLEDEQERAKSLEQEMEGLRQQTAHGSASTAGELRNLQMDLDDMREAKERAEAMLANAMGQR